MGQRRLLNSLAIIVVPHEQLPLGTFQPGQSLIYHAGRLPAVQEPVRTVSLQEQDVVLQGEAFAFRAKTIESPVAGDSSQVALDLTGAELVPVVPGS